MYICVLKTKITFYFSLLYIYIYIYIKPVAIYEDVTKKYAFKLTFIFMMYLS